MTENYVFDIPSGSGSVVEYLTPRGHVCPLSGLTLMAMPPGRVDVEIEISVPTLNVLPYRGDRVLHICHNGENQSHIESLGPRAMFHAGGDLSLSALNNTWECLLEIDPARMSALAPERMDGAPVPVEFFVDTSDPTFRILGDLAIRHLRAGPPDLLYTEGLAIALAARALAFDRETTLVSTRGTDPRIARAMDYIEAHLGEDLSVAAIARAAAMSPSWFQSAFRAVTGRPVFAYVRERRLERARILLADPRLSLSQIAFACGFSSHSHMTRLFTARYGVSPRNMR